MEQRWQYDDNRQVPGHTRGRKTLSVAYGENSKAIGISNSSIVWRVRLQLAALAFYPRQEIEMSDERKKKNGSDEKNLNDLLRVSQNILRLLEAGQAVNQGSRIHLDLRGVLMAIEGK